MSEFTCIHQILYQRLCHCILGKHPLKQEKAVNATLTWLQKAGIVDYIELLDTKENKTRFHKVNTTANKILYNAGQD